jgi:hypothetical protein
MRTALRIVRCLVMGFAGLASATFICDVAEDDQVVENKHRVKIILTAGLASATMSWYRSRTLGRT